MSRVTIFCKKNAQRLLGRLVRQGNSFDRKQEIIQEFQSICSEEKKLTLGEIESMRRDVEKINADLPARTLLRHIITLWYPLNAKENQRYISPLFHEPLEEDAIPLGRYLYSRQEIINIIAKKDKQGWKNPMANLPLEAHELWELLIALITDWHLCEFQADEDRQLCIEAIKKLLNAHPEFLKKNTTGLAGHFITTILGFLSDSEKFDFLQHILSSFNIFKEQIQTSPALTQILCHFKEKSKREYIIEQFWAVQRPDLLFFFQVEQLSKWNKREEENVITEIFDGALKQHLEVIVQLYWESKSIFSKQFIKKMIDKNTQKIPVNSAKLLEIQWQFLNHLDMLNSQLKSDSNDPTIWADGARLYSNLLEQQNHFFKKMYASPDQVKVHWKDFCREIEKQVDLAERIMGPDWLSRGLEILMKGLGALVVGAAMGIGSLIGQGFLNSQHSQFYRNTFFTLKRSAVFQELQEFQNNVRVINANALF